MTIVSEIRDPVGILIATGLAVEAQGKIIPVDSFDYSGEPEEVMEAFGFIDKQAVNKFKSLLNSR